MKLGHPYIWARYHEPIISVVGSKIANEMTAGNGSKLRGNTRYTYSVHMINHKNVINVHSIDVILPVLTSWHTQHKRTIEKSSMLVEVVRVYHFPRRSGELQLLKKFFAVGKDLCRIASSKAKRSICSSVSV